MSAISQAGLESSVSFVSTGGGTMLEMIEGKGTSGIATIKHFHDEDTPSMEGFKDELIKFRRHIHAHLNYLLRKRDVAIYLQYSG